MSEKVEYYGGPDANWEFVTSQRKYTKYHGVPAICKGDWGDNPTHLEVYVDDATGLLVSDIAKFERWIG